MLHFERAHPFNRADMVVAYSQLLYFYKRFNAFEFLDVVLSQVKHLYLAAG